MLDSRKVVGFSLKQIDRLAATGTLRNYGRIRILISVGDISGARAEFDRDCAKSTKGDKILDTEVDVPWFGVAQGLLGSALSGVSLAIGFFGLKSVEFDGYTVSCRHCGLTMKIDYTGTPVCTTRSCIDHDPGRGERVTVDRGEIE